MTSSSADRTGSEGARRRRLRAVFAADVSNFGGLVSIDETKTFDSLWTMRRIVLKELEVHGGWLFGLPGDGIFALFESAVEAVRCALQAQAKLSAEPLLNALQLRIGVHLGEVLFQDDVPFGESLVIAARLESLAEPGGILVSAAVMEAVAPRIPATFVERGVRSLKHSPRMIATFSVLPPPPRDRAPEPAPGFVAATPDPPGPADAPALHPHDSLAEIEAEATTEKGQALPQAGLHPDAAAAPPQLMPAPSPAPGRPHDPAPVPLVLPDPAAGLDDPTTAIVHDAAPPSDLHLPRAAPLVLPPEPDPPHPPAPATPALRPAVSGGGPYPEPFLREVTLLLTTYVGPFAKVLVRARAETTPAAAVLVQALAAEIPVEAERASFVARAQDLVRRLG